MANHGGMTNSFIMRGEASTCWMRSLVCPSPASLAARAPSSPNPLLACVFVQKCDGPITVAGLHSQAGGPFPKLLSLSSHRRKTLLTEFKNGCKSGPHAVHADQRDMLEAAAVEIAFYILYEELDSVFAHELIAACYSSPSCN